MTRIKELVAAVTLKYPKDRFFADFEQSCAENPSKGRYYRTYEDALRHLDPPSWQVLKAKAISQFLNHRSGQTKQGFFNQLNEAFAYRYLVRRGCAAIEMLPESKTTTPDLRYQESGSIKHCEVKTLSISSAEIGRRQSKTAFDAGETYQALARGFFKKLDDDFKTAMNQIASQGTEGLVYFVWVCDDICLDFYERYKPQIRSHCRGEHIHGLHVKVGLRGNRRISIP